METLCPREDPRNETSCSPKPGLRGTILPDGTAWIVAGEWPQFEFPFTSHYQFHAIVSTAFGTALGDPQVIDACPLIAAKPGELLGATPACHTCKLGCATQCNDARQACKLKGNKQPKWADCVKPVLPSYATCAKACDDAVVAPAK